MVITRTYRIGIYYIMAVICVRRMCDNLFPNKNVYYITNSKKYRYTDIQAPIRLDH